MNKLPDLEAWALFAKVAETGSFSKAAAELSLAPATVSKAITRLESHAKITLFHRTSRRISLTGSGHAALERATRILEEGEAVEAEIVEQSAILRGPVRVTAPMSFGVVRLPPMLRDFMGAHGKIELDVQLTDEVVDLIANRFDVALRISHMADSSLRARRLCTVRVLLVGAPAYFERYGRPTHPRELREHHAMVYTYTRGGSAWRFRHKRDGNFAQTMPTQLRANNAEVFTPALHAGLGLALQPEFLVAEDLRAGVLETAMPDWQVDPLALHIITPPGRRRPARVQAFIDFLATELSDES
jgi:DNA-binding transcriptional LysR family regulator